MSSGDPKQKGPEQSDLFGGLAPSSKPPAGRDGRVPAWRRTSAPVVAEQPAAPAPAPRAAVEAERQAPKEPAPARQVFTVSQLTRQVKDTLEPRFTRVFVRGEISNFRGVNARGHYYFALSDGRASIDVKLWATTAARLKFQLKEGLSVLVEGSLDVYEPQGRYSLIVDRVEPEGLGAQALRVEQLKQKLVGEGLIGPQRVRPPRPLPFLPRRIGVVTSLSGAALRDFLKVLHRRHPGLSVLVADARVQGDGAVFELRRALRWLANTDCDVIVVTRGGGSADDLAWFSEEPVVRAVYASPVPVVSAVGHEIDTTLCDLVADVRAPTPSAAAELIAPSLVDLRATLATLKSRLLRGLEKQVLAERNRLQELTRRLGDPRRELSSQRLIISTAADRMRAVLSRRTRAEGARLQALKSRLRDPRHVLAAQRMALRQSGERLRSALQRRTRTEQARLGELRARLLRGSPVASLQRQREAVRTAGDKLRDAVRRGRERKGGALTELRARLLKRPPAVGDARARLALLSRALERQSPRQGIGVARAGLVEQRTRLAEATRERLKQERDRFLMLAATLDALSPLKVLTRGYALARHEGRVVRSAADVQPGDQLTLRFAEGEVTVEVLATTTDSESK